MTPGTGLYSWKKIGTLDRELKPYIELTKSGWKVKILTFDKEPIPLPEGIESICFPHPYLLFYLARSHRHLGEWADLLKTNQTHGSWFYVWASRSWKKPILLRGGYIQGEFYETTLGPGLRVAAYQEIEKWAFQNATHCQMTTPELSRWIQDKYAVPRHKISVIPNFVDTDIFNPRNNIPKIENSIVSVGRLDQVKQFDLLIRACGKIPNCNITLIGEGPEKSKLESLARELEVKIKFSGNVANEALPELIQKHQVFAVTSVREGHSKALIEAMSCGMPIIGTNVPGLKNTIQNGSNGLLVESNEDAIKQGILKLLKDAPLRSFLGNEAREFIISNCSKEVVFQKDFELLDSLYAK